MAIQHKIMTIVGAKKSSVKNKMRCCLFDWKWSVYCLEIKKKWFPFIHPSANWDNLQFVALNKRNRCLPSPEWRSSHDFVLFPGGPFSSSYGRYRLLRPVRCSFGPVSRNHPKPNHSWKQRLHGALRGPESDNWSVRLRPVSFSVCSHGPGESGLLFESYGENEVWVLWVCLSQQSSVIQCCQTVTHCRFSPGVSQITVLCSCSLFHCFIPIDFCHLLIWKILSLLQNIDSILILHQCVKTIPKGSHQHFTAF